MSEEKIIVGRPINGISLNGLEYMLDPDGNEVLFDSIDDAKQMLMDNGIEGNDLEDCFVYKKVKMMGTVLVAVD